MGDKELRILCYGDDAVLLSNTKDDLQRFLYKFTVTAKQYNKIISFSETEAMVI